MERSERHSPEESAPIGLGASRPAPGSSLPPGQPRTSPPSVTNSVPPFAKSDRPKVDGPKVDGPLADRTLAESALPLGKSLGDVSSPPPPEEPESEEPESEEPESEEPESDESVSGFAPVLRNFNFVMLWSGQVFSQLADKVYLVLMIALISRNFQSPGESISRWVSANMIAFTIPAVLFGSLAGVLVDRQPKKLVLVLSNLLRGLLVLTLPLILIVTADRPGILGLPLGFESLLVVTFLVSTLTQFFAPAEQAIIPLIVEKRYLLSANSLYTTTMMAASIVGFAVGENVLNLADRWVLALSGLHSGKPIGVGVSYIIAGLLLLVVRVQEPKAEAEPPHVWSDIKDGLRYLRDNRVVKGALIQLIILFSVLAAIAVLAVRIAEVIPDLETDQFGWLLSSGSLGLAIGAVIIGQYGNRLSRAHVGLWGTLAMAASLVSLALGLTLWNHPLTSSVLSLGVMGLGAAFVGIPTQTTIQEQTPPEMRGKVFGLQNNAVNIALTLPLALAGIAEQAIGLEATLLGLAALLVAGSLSTWYISAKGYET
jgi:MFS family permease